MWFRGRVGRVAFECPLAPPPSGEVDALASQTAVVRRALWEQEFYLPPIVLDLIVLSSRATRSSIANGFRSRTSSSAAAKFSL